MEAENKRLIPFMAVPPIESVREEMKARGMKRKELAKKLGIKTHDLSRMFKKGASITEQLASKLESAFGISADFWLRFQSNYESDKKAIEERKRRDSNL